MHIRANEGGLLTMLLVGDGSMSYQLDGEVTAHHGYDG